MEPWSPPSLEPGLGRKQWGEGFSQLVLWTRLEECYLTSACMPLGQRVCPRVSRVFGSEGLLGHLEQKVLPMPSHFGAAGELVNLGCASKYGQVWAKQGKSCRVCPTALSPHLRSGCCMPSTVQGVQGRMENVAEVAGDGKGEE